MNFIAKALDRISGGGGEAKTASAGSAAADARSRVRMLSSSAVILSGVDESDSGSAGAEEGATPSSAMFRQISLPTEWSITDDSVQTGLDDCVFGFASMKTPQKSSQSSKDLARSRVGALSTFTKAAETLRVDVGTAWTRDVEAAFVSAKTAYKSRNLRKAVCGQHTYGTALFDSRSPSGPRASKVRAADALQGGRPAAPRTIRRIQRLVPLHHHDRCSRRWPTSATGDQLQARSGTQVYD